MPDIGYSYRSIDPIYTIYIQNFEGKFIFKEV